jgi:saccharopine dehydrogenase (NAD+, L-lysine-forming)
MTGRVLLYGATGFSGRLLAARLREAGLDVVLAGRDGVHLPRLAAALGMPCRVFGLGPGAPVDAALADIAVVLHAAGPFQHTAAPMLAACIRTRTHYLDLAGEWPVFAAAMACSPAAGAARVMLMPGVGFSLVASDCLLALAAASVPDAALLRLCISQPETIARGTVRSAVGQAAATVLVRRGGQLRAAPAGSLVRAFDFGDGARPATAITLPDVVTGQFTTGVADIETYCEADWTVRLTQLASAAAAPWMKTGSGQALARLYSLAWPATPSEAARRRGRLTLVVEAVDRWRRSRALRLRTLDGYSVTALAATEIVRRVLRGEHAPGFRTPASLFGAGFILQLGCAALEPA